MTVPWEYRHTFELPSENPEALAQELRWSLKEYLRPPRVDEITDSDGIIRFKVRRTSYLLSQTWIGAGRGEFRFETTDSLVRVNCVLSLRFAEAEAILKGVLIVVAILMISWLLPQQSIPSARWTVKLVLAMAGLLALFVRAYQIARFGSMMRKCAKKARRQMSAG